MKLSFLLIFFTLVQVTATSYSQSISLDLKNIEIRQAIKSIENQSDYRFFYTDGLTDLGRRISIRVNGRNIEQIMTEMLADTQLGYRIVDNKLIIVAPKAAIRQIVITGTVNDDAGDPMPGVNVLVKGTLVGSVTDALGRYSITVPDKNSILVFSFIGYTTQEIAIQDRTVIDIVLGEDNQQLEEVVVVGYGVQKKKLVTGATVQVKGDDITKRNTTSAIQALQGQTPGVQITSKSGQPGEGFKLNIRGLGTNGSADPLYIVDGITTGDIGYLNPADIESMDILKDAASAAIYGSRAANGVILITTRQGKKGKVSVSYDGYYGVQNLFRKMDMLTAPEYAIIMDEAAVNSGKPVWDYSSLGVNLNEIGNGTDWFDEIIVKNAPTQSHAINITGGSDQSVFSMGMSYTNQEGILGGVVNSEYSRYTFRINSEHHIYKDILKIGENLVFSYSEKSGFAVSGLYSNSLHSFLNVSPFLPMYDNDGKYHQSIAWSPAQSNPVGSMEYNNTNKTRDEKILGNLYIELEPVRNLKWRSVFGIEVSSGSWRSYVPDYKLSTTDLKTNLIEMTMNRGIGNLQWENTISYHLDLGHHAITGLVGNTLQKNNLGDDIGGKKTGALYNDFGHAWFDNATAVTYPGWLTGAPWIESKLLSYFARINYNYRETYLLSALIRGDGSSMFAPGKQWGYFPSVSAGWVISNEKFMESTYGWMNFLKVRGSWGQNGNQAIDPFQYLATISTENSDYFLGGTDGRVTGAYPNIIPNPDVTWETSQQLNLGIDARFFSNQLAFTFDWYHKETRDWLVQAPVLASWGADPPYINGGDVRNKGVEIGLVYQNNIGDFNYKVGANMSYNDNNVTRIANSEGIIHGDPNVLVQGIGETYRIQEDYPFGYFWGFKTDGIFQNQQEVNNYKYADGTLIQPNALPGDVRFVDADGKDGITDADKMMIGKPNPDYTFGFNIAFDYKGLDFSLVTSGVWGNQIAKGYRSFDTYQSNWTTEILQRWTGEGTSNRMPRVTMNDEPNKNWLNFSDLYIEDAGYFRINNITIGYDFKRLLPDFPLAMIRLYVSAQNLYTFTPYSGMDPELGFGPTDWASGIDLGYYPQPRTYLVGLNVKF